MRIERTLQIPFLAIILCLFPVSRPALAGTGDPKVIILELHGMMNGVIADNLDTLPNFRELIRGADGTQSHVHMPRVFTTIPAASQPAVTAMFTGLYPQRAGVVSTISMDREDAQIKTMISYSQQRINRTLTANGVKSLFDYVREGGKTSHTSMLMLTKGADWSLRSGAFFWGNASALTFIREGRWFPDSRYVDTKTLEALLTGHVFSYEKSLANLLRHRKTIPDLTVVQLLGMDLFSHYPPAPLRARDAPMEEIQTTYARTVLDPLVGRLTGFLKEAGVYQDMIFFLISEHGFVKIQRHLSDRIVDRSLAKEFRLPSVETSNRRAEAVIMIGACTKEIYLKNRASGRWMDPPRLLHDVKPAVDLLLADTDIRNALNAMVVRKYPGERHEGVEETGAWWSFDFRAYQGTARQPADFLSALSPLDALQSRFELGKFVTNGLTRQYTRKTAPDIKLVNRKGVYYERDFTKYGHHGSYYPEDCIVSLWIAGPGLGTVLPGRHTLGTPASTLDVVPMALYVLGLPEPEGLDGGNPLRGLVHKAPSPGD